MTEDRRGGIGPTTRETNNTIAAEVSGVVIQAGTIHRLIYHGPEQFAEDPTGECPYLGLRSFDQEYAKWFFGREHALAELRTQMDRARQEDGGPVVVIGASGAGKSSLLQCGLINAVTTNGYGEPESRNWPYQVLTPTGTPLSLLRTELAAIAGRDVDDPAVLREALGCERLLLVIDQFEELYTLCEDVAERDRYVDLLGRLSAGPDAPVMLVIGLRADFYGHCLAYPMLSAALRDNAVQLGPMSRVELELVVRQPAAKVGLTIQPALVEALLADMGVGTMPGEDVSGRLPLLAHALRATWLKRNGDTLTLAGYQDTGGIHGAIAATADRTFAKLSDPAKAAARAVFLRLVHIGADTEDTRRHITYPDLAQHVAEPASVAEVVDAYTARRLITRERQGITITHEALLRTWGTLRSWIDEDRAGNIERQELETHAQAWESHTRGLLDDVSLRTAEEWRREHQDEVTAPVAALLTASRRVIDRRRRSRRVFVALVSVLALVASTLAGFALYQQRQAEAQRTTAVARLVATESKNLLDSQPGIAKQLALTAYHLDRTSGTGALFSALTTPGIFDSADGIVDLAATSDRRTLALSTGSAIALWSTAGHEVARIAGASNVGAVAFGVGDRILAAAVTTMWESSVQLWSLANPSSPRLEAKLPVDKLDSVAIGRGILAAGSADGMIKLWDVSHPATPRPLPSLPGHPGGVDSLAFAPSAPMLASSGADHQVRLWSIADPSHPQLLSTIDGYHGNDDAFDDAHYTAVHHRIGFSPDSKTLLAPGDTVTNDLRFWDVRTPTDPRPLDAPKAGSSAANGDSCGESLRSVSFSPDGKFAVTSCARTLILWQTPDASGRFHALVAYTFPYVLSGGNGSAIFAPHGLSVLHATLNGVQDWDIADPYEPGALTTMGWMPGGFGATMAFSGSRRRLLAAVGNGNGQLWDAEQGKELATLAGSVGEWGAAAFSPDESVLATSEYLDNSLTVSLRDMNKSGAPILSTLTGEIDNGVEALSYSPDGKFLAVADNSGLGQQSSAPAAVKLFDVSNPKTPNRIATVRADVFEVAYSPQGHVLTANTADTMLSWDVSDPKHPDSMTPIRLSHGSTASRSVFSADGKLLAIGDSTGTTQIWRIADGRPQDSPGIVRSVGSSGLGMAFSPDDRILAVNNPAADGPTQQSRIEMWDVSDPQSPVLQAQFDANQVHGIARYSAPIIFSPSGHILISGLDQKIDLWSADPDEIAPRLCQAVGDVISPAQWRSYVPDESYAPPCAS